MKILSPTRRRPHVVLAAAIVVALPTLAVAGFRIVDDLPPPATLAAPAASSSRAGLPAHTQAGVTSDARLAPSPAAHADGGEAHLEAIETRLTQVEAEIRRLTAERDYYLSAYTARYGKATAKDAGEGDASKNAPAKLPVSDGDTTLMTVRFALGSRDFHPEPETAHVLLEAAQHSPRIVIQGYTDASGTPQANAAVAAGRALAARTFLTKHGIAAARISAIGMKDGYAFPNTTGVGRASNRRVEIRFYPDPSGRALTQVTP